MDPGPPVDDGLVARRERERLDTAIELVSALELVLEEREVLGEHDAILLGQHVGLEHLTDPVQVARGPVRAFAVDEPAAAQELEDVVAGLDDLALEGLSAADQVADPLVVFGRNVDEDEAVVAEVAGDLDGITAIGLAVLTGSGRDERGSGELTRDAPVGESALKHVPCSGSFVAGAGRSFGGEALEVPAQLLVVVGESIDSHRLGFAVAKHGDRDRVLVDVEADREH
jgi:hypothetical protein